MANKYRTDIDYDMSVEYPEYEIKGYYKSVSYHRNGTADKSQWSISVDDKAGVLGYTEHYSETRLARFIDGSRSNHWHGYPANYLRAKNDIPPISLLRIWKERGLIGKSDITRMKYQKPCSLQKSL